MHIHLTQLLIRLQKNDCARMQVLENANGKLTLKNNEKKVCIVTSVLRPKIIAATVGPISVHQLFGKLSNKINNDVKGTINLQNLDL